MFMFGSILLFVVVLAMILLVVMFGVKFKTPEDLEKLSPFECGFIPQGTARSLFSIHFFLIAILFLIFDVELVLLFPLFANLASSELSTLGFLILLLLLMVGLLYEWAQKMLDWSDF